VTTANRLDRYRKQALKKVQNNLFSVDQQLLHKHLLEKNVSHDSIEPDGPKVVDFWSGIWSREQSHNQSAKWLEHLS